MPEIKLGELLKNHMQSIMSKFSRFTGKFSSLQHPKLSKKIINKKRFVLSISTALLFVLISSYIYVSGIAYSVQVNGVEVGKVKNISIAANAQKSLEEEYKSIANANIKLTAEITTSKTRGRGKEIMDEAQLLEAFKNVINYNIETFSIYADGSVIAILKSKEEAEEVLSAVKEHYLAGVDTAKLKEVSFAENIEVKQEYNDLNKVMQKDEVVSFVIKGTNEERTHKVVSGESFWSISRKYNMNTDDLIKANPTVNPNKLQIDQVLSLIIPKPLISVKTVETVTYTDKILFEQKIEFSDSLYADQTSIKVKGVPGEKEVIADIVKVNGLETERTILSEKVIKEPKEQILIKGTKPIPPKKGTGTFSMPTRGRLTSKFGKRWGRMHEGIDLAAPVGTAVKAADGGTVKWVGTKGGYGKLIIIDHGAGFVSYYGHLSKYNVSVGDKVYKGQKIGAVGNTGRSTGPHLHFEIRKNGVPVNPLKYLK
ncbi:MAG: peptidoglycan DD-metalloendopeptidase family protein [Bacillota bacterium]